jgi:hypothetical protein
MKPGAGGNIENFDFLTPFQDIYKEAAFALGPRLSINQIVPFLDELLYIFFLIMLGIADFEWFLAKVLFQYG